MLLYYIPQTTALKKSSINV